MRRNPRQIAALVAASTLVAGMLVGGGWLIGRSGTPPSGAPAPGPSATATNPPTPIPTPSPTTVPPPMPTTAPSQPAGVWRVLPPAPVTEWKYDVTAAWTGSEVLFYQAHPIASEPQTRTGLAYNPTTRRWRKLAPIPVPVYDAEGTLNAVWTGQEMIVRGLVNGAYNPATNRWRPLGTSYFSPGPGAGAVVVWTGRQVLSWGGGCCEAFSAGGAAYTPATDSFRALPAGPLSARRTAGTWTGTEMVIAGGEGRLDDPRIGGTTALADAAAYNPVTRTWRRLPPLPAPRMNATVTWTGTEVLVVGGQAGHSSYRMYTDGAAYNPATNRWRRIPAMPVGRAGYTAVWTGDQLLVWGGRTMRDGTWTTPPRGYAYHPTTNQWTALPISPLRGRIDHAAVWTGSRMLIWGGEPVGGASPSAPPFVDGATYTP